MKAVFIGWKYDCFAYNKIISVVNYGVHFAWKIEYIMLILILNFIYYFWILKLNLKMTCVYSFSYTEL